MSQPQLRLVATAYFTRMDVEMRHLRALLALAEELNFTRAAERLHLTQVWSDFWTAATHRNGTPPQIGASVTTLDGLMEAIGAGLGVATTVALAIDMLGAAAGVVFSSSPTTLATRLLGGPPRPRRQTPRRGVP